MQKIQLQTPIQTNKGTYTHAQVLMAWVNFLSDGGVSVRLEWGLYAGADFKEAGETKETIVELTPEQIEQFSAMVIPSHLTALNKTDK